jgi:hypothetical protein
VHPAKNRSRSHLKNRQQRQNRDLGGEEGRDQR